MRTVDQILAWIVIALGIVHCAFTTFLYHSFSLAAVWFFSAGVALILNGALNIFRARSGRIAGMKFACVFGNAALLCVAIAAGISMRVLSANPQVPVLVVALALELLFSLQK